MIRLFYLLLLLPFSAPANEIDSVLAEMAGELKRTRAKYELQYRHKSMLIESYEHRLLRSAKSEEKIKWLLKRDSVKQVVQQIHMRELADVSRIRYLKGLQVIRILYDKVLALEHHFASVRTFHEINKISNPNHYPEFGKLKEVLEKAKRREGLVQLSGVLGTNTIASVVMALGNIVNSGLSRKEQQRELENVECILDFTLRMHNDLNTIYFETAFLQKSNEKIRQDVEVLFRDYTKPIGYATTLSDCRGNDDWETIKQKTDEFIGSLKTVEERKAGRMHVDIDFSVDRLLQFITQYNAFIDQGGKFYEKFRIILSSYENETQCETKLPPEYAKLKADVALAIEKFNTAYKPIELNGSKMKEILYGINEFE